MHACEIADTLDIATVIAPRHAGVLSALGMLLADVTKDYSLTVLRPAARRDARRAARPLRAAGRAGATRISRPKASAAIARASNARSTSATSASPTRSPCRSRHGYRADVRRAASADLRLRQSTPRRRGRQPAGQGDRRHRASRRCRADGSTRPLPRARAVGAPHRRGSAGDAMPMAVYPTRRSARRHGRRRARADRRTASDDGHHASVQIPRRRAATSSRRDGLAPSPARRAGLADAPTTAPRDAAHRRR